MKEIFTYVNGVHIYKLSVWVLALITQTLALLLFSALILAQPTQAGWFDSASSWSDDDKKNFCHFYSSQEAGNSAISIVDSASDFSVIPKEDMQRVSEYYQLALQEAQLVQDNVIDKIEPEMKQHYRNEYQRSYELKLDGMRTQNPLSMIQSNELYNQWVYWVNDAKSRFKIPKGTRSKCQN